MHVFVANWSVLLQPLLQEANTNGSPAPTTDAERQTVTSETAVGKGGEQEAGSHSASLSVYATCQLGFDGSLPG
jgi:hypothetical protein